MANPQSTEHRYVSNTALPYVTLDSVTSTDPRFADGSNILTSIRGYSERRPGFATVSVPAPTAGWNGTIKNIRTWRRWDSPDSGATRGAFFAMISTVDASNSYVYKFQYGTDTEATLLKTQAGAEPFRFVVSNNTCFMGNGASGSMLAYDGTTLRNWGIVSPASAPGVSLSGTGITAVAAGFYYTYTYFNTNTGHESSPATVSACTGVFTNQQVNVSVIASTDTQVTNIRVYRSTDGGQFAPNLMLEIAGSPFTNTTQTVVDTTADTSLGSRTAPPYFRNDPPPVGIPECWYSGRIWLRKNNQLWYSGAEEILFGVPEECWPAGQTGNFYNWDSQVNGIAALADGVGVYTAETRYKVEGYTLDTFWRYTLSSHQGTRQGLSVKSFGAISTWLDTSGSLWIEPGQELSSAIRPSLLNIDQTQTQTAIHMQGDRRWICLLDGANSRVFVYDTETEQWMPPWNFAHGITAIASGETSVGVFDLLIAYNGQIVKMTGPTSYVNQMPFGAQYNDAGDTFSSYAITNLFSITPDAPPWWRWNMDTFTNPLWRGTVDSLGLEMNSHLVSDILQITDESTASTATGDATTVGWVSLKANERTPDKRYQGSLLVEKEYPSGSQTFSGRRIGMWLKWPSEDSGFILYSIAVGYHQTFTGGGK